MSAQTDLHVLLSSELEARERPRAKGLSFDADGNLLALTVDGSDFVATGEAGTVSGPASVSDEAVAVFDGTDGFAIKAVTPANVPLTTPSVQDIIDALVALGLVEQSDPA